MQLLVQRNPPQFFQSLFACTHFCLPSFPQIYTTDSIVYLQHRSSSLVSQYSTFICSVHAPPNVLRYTCTHIYNIYTHTLHVAWIAFDSTLKRLQDLIYDTRLCWGKCCRTTQIPGQAKEMVRWCFSCPKISCSHPSVSPHHAAIGSPGLSSTSYSQPSPFLWLPEVCGTYLQAFSFWKILTNRKFSHFPGQKPNLYIRNACPYFQFFPFSDIPRFLSGNAQLRLSGL